MQWRPRAAKKKKKVPNKGEVNRKRFWIAPTFQSPCLSLSFLSFPFFSLRFHGLQMMWKSISSLSHTYLIFKHKLSSYKYAVTILLCVCFKCIFEATTLSYLVIKYGHHVINGQNSSSFSPHAAKSFWHTLVFFLSPIQMHCFDSTPCLNSCRRVEGTCMQL